MCDDCDILFYALNYQLINDTSLKINQKLFKAYIILSFLYVKYYCTTVLYRSCIYFMNELYYTVDLKSKLKSKVSLFLHTL